MTLVVGDADLTLEQKTLYAAAVVLLVLGAGLMSGLTLGLLSLDVMDLEVMKAAGTPKQRTSAARLISLVTRPHWLLCTLLLCNAACMEALPLFLDRLLNPMAAVLLSITAILVFGEIIPQAVCSRYGVVIGACFAPTVKILMYLCSPVSWPLGKMLDFILGHEESAMERNELKAMVQLHTPEAGFGGMLTADEVAVIHGALDLNQKNALSAMTPLDKVFMLSDEAVLDNQLIQQVLMSGHSRLPVCRGGDRTDICGLVLVKELLQFWQAAVAPRVSQLNLRPLPRISADTLLFDVLKLFQTGNSHMALLLAPSKPRMDYPGSLRCSLCNKGHDSLKSALDMQCTCVKQLKASLQCCSKTRITLNQAQGNDVNNSNNLCSSSCQEDWTITSNRGSTDSSSSSNMGLYRSNSNEGCDGDAGYKQAAAADAQHCGGVGDAIMTDEPCLQIHSSTDSSSSSSCNHRQLGLRKLLERVRSSSRQRRQHQHQQQLQGYIALELGQFHLDGAAAAAAGIADSMTSNGSATLTPIGIITLEDVVEELLQVDILDETDTYTGNQQSARGVDLQCLTRSSSGLAKAPFRELSQASRTSLRHSLLKRSGVDPIAANLASKQPHKRLLQPDHPLEMLAVGQLSRTGVPARPLATLCRGNPDAVRHSMSFTVAELQPGLVKTHLTAVVSPGVTSRRGSANSAMMVTAGACTRQRMRSSDPGVTRYLAAAQYKR